MYSISAWHAEGLRWIADVLEDVADFLERPGHETPPCAEADRVSEARLRAHLRGFQ
ncbi:MAG TPA: hypothetical protein VLJ84_13240 [Usitatibacter sp.]|nr:hypothetical protein [Usitatibacter sp.]HST02616.1 hypothetical protein [Usitatibacter sp.]